MQISSFLRGAGLATALAMAIITGDAGTYAQTVLPTGATITPNAAKGSVFHRLTVALPNFTTTPLMVLRLQRSVQMARPCSSSPAAITLTLIRKVTFRLQIPVSSYLCTTSLSPKSP
jgi:hypothetical protein